MPPNPYFLVYVAEDQITTLVETVRREVVWPVPDQPPPALPERRPQTQAEAMAMQPQTNGVHNTAHDEDIARQMEQREYQDYQNSKPAAFKNTFPSEQKDQGAYAPPIRAEKEGSWDSREADSGRTQRW